MHVPSEKSRFGLNLVPEKTLLQKYFPWAAFPVRMNKIHSEKFHTWAPDVLRKRAHILFKKFFFESNFLENVLENFYGF